MKSHYCFENEMRVRDGSGILFLLISVRVRAKKDIADSPTLGERPINNNNNEYPSL